MDSLALVFFRFLRLSVSEIVRIVTRGTLPLVFALSLNARLCDGKEPAAIDETILEGDAEGVDEALSTCAVGLVGAEDCVRVDIYALFLKAAIV